MTSERPLGGSLHPTGEQPLTVAVERLATAVVISAAGELDMATAPQLARTIDSVLDETPELLVVDLTAVEFLGSAGLSVLLVAHDKAGGRTGFRVVAAGRATLRPIQITQMDQRLSVHASRQEALTES